MGKKGRLLRKLLRRKGIVVAPGAYDALGARLIEVAGFEALYLTGFGCSASLLGKPDLGLITLTELSTIAGNVNNAITVPVIADCESGFGNVLNVQRAVREYEKAGVAALHIEDQIIPAKHKPDGRPQVVPVEEHLNKIKAAIEARENDDTIIIGRTDALGRYGLKEAVKRANAYFEAGCDMVFVHGAGTPKELGIIAKEIVAPQVINYSTILETGIKPGSSVSDLGEMGFRLVIFPSILLFTAAGIMRNALLEFRKSGRLTRYAEEMMSLADFKEIVDWHGFVSGQKKYLPS